MGGALISDAELCWVVQAHEPAQTATIAVDIPIEQISAYVRLRSLNRRGYVTSSTSLADRSDEHIWSVTERGQTLITSADLPPAAETDFEAYFAGRTNSLDRETLLRELAAHDGSWVSSSTLYDPLPYSKVAIRNNLHNLHNKDLVALDEGNPGTAHNWRLTDTGRERLAATCNSEQVSPSP